MTEVEKKHITDIQYYKHEALMFKQKTKDLEFKYNDAAERNINLNIEIEEMSEKMLLAKNKIKKKKATSPTRIKVSS